MGLFSDEEVVYVATSVSRVIPDNRIMSSITSGTTKAIFAHGEISDYILEDLINGIGTRAHSYWRYGQNKYAFGVPSGQSITPYIPTDKVQAVIEGFTGEPVLLDYVGFGRINYRHLAWKYFHYIEYPYNYDTHVIGPLSTPTNPMVLDYLLLTMRQDTADRLGPGSLSDFAPGVRIAIDAGIPLDQVQLSMQSHHQATQGDPPSAYTENVTTVLVSDLTPAGFNPAADYFMVRYRTISNNTVGYWEYAIGSGTYPTLDHAFDVPHAGTGSYFPFGYFRYNKTRADADKSSQEYITGKRLMRRLGINYDDMINSIDQNPNIVDVEQAMLFLAVPPNPTSTIETRYLFDYWDSLFSQMRGETTTYAREDVGLLFYNANFRDAALVIQDARFKMLLSTQGLFKRVVTGAIGAVGSHAMTSVRVPVLYVVDPGDGSTPWEATGYIDTYCYQKQINSTQYEELQVCGLRMKYFIWGEYTTTGNTETSEAILLVPLDLSVTSLYGLVEREELYTRALHYVFNSRVTVTLAWYQQDFFQFLLVVAAVVIAVYTGQEEFVAWAEGIAAGTITVEAALYALAVKLVDAVIAQYLIKLFVKAVGVDIALIVAIIALAYGYGEALQNDLKNLPPLAQNLLTAGNGLIKGVQGYYKDEVQSIAEDIAGIQNQAKVLNDAIQKVNDELYQSSKLTPFINVSESPDQYFNRTVHSGNIGMIGIDAVSNFVERSLSLPKLTNPFGEVA